MKNDNFKVGIIILKVMRKVYTIKLELLDFILKAIT